MEFYKSIRFGHLYIIAGSKVYVIIDGLPFISTLTEEYILDNEHAYFTNVTALAVESL